MTTLATCFKKHTTTQATRSLSALDRVMAYKNSRIIEKMMMEYGLSYDDADQLFTDTKRFLYLCHKYPDAFSPTPRLDDGWHTMILFTRDYAQFCREHFGRFVHHIPTVPSDSERNVGVMSKRLTELAVAEFGENLSNNWNQSSGHKAEGRDGNSSGSCCNGGNCSNSGACSHCTSE
jgi:hypothetical protein